MLKTDVAAEAKMIADLARKIFDKEGDVEGAIAEHVNRRFNVVTVRAFCKSMRFVERRGVNKALTVTTLNLLFTCSAIAPSTSPSLSKIFLARSAIILASAATSVFNILPRH